MNTRTADIDIGWTPAAPTGDTVPPPLVDRVPLVAEAQSAHGPLLRRRLYRLYGLFAVFFLLGLAPLALDSSPALKALGLGLLLPGAGFLHVGGLLGVLFAAVSAAAFMVILFYWWARGVVLAPPAVWLGSAVLAAAWSQYTQHPGVQAMEWAIPVAALLVHGGFALKRRRSFDRLRARGQAANADITQAEPVMRDYPVTAGREMPPAQIKEFRRMLDLALQPVDSWNGFDMSDTWQDGALRYQICTMSWNLACGQYTQLPAFHGYLNRAQENLIRKHIDRKTWNYWYWESLWGNLQLQKNPINIDNIMLSGFLGVSLGLFETASGTSPFKAPGSLTFRWDDKLQFPYSHETMLREVVKNFNRYDLGWFPCEPHWIYSMCNLVGRTALELHDARHGTRLVDEVRHTFDRTMSDEMTLPDGRIRVCTSSLYGFTVPSLSGLFGESWGIRFITPHAPELAERIWRVLKRDFISRDPSGRLNFKLLPLGWDTRKPANFQRWPEMYPLIVTLWAALEMGDDEIIDATRTEIDKRYGEGVADSVTWTGRNTMRNMVTKGLPKAWATGPILDDAEYPQVIVGRAVTDGHALSLVLHPGAEHGPARLGFARLVPGRKYRAVQTDAAFTANADGRAELIVPLEGRMELDIVPVS